MSVEQRMFLLYLGNLARKDIVSPFPLKYLKMGVLFGQSVPYIPAFGAPALSHLLRSKERARTHQAELTPTSSPFFRHFTNSFCEQMKRLRPKKKRSPCGRKKTFFRRAKNFRAHAGKFLCAQKNIFVRTKIYFLPQENFTLCGRRLIPLHNKQLGEALKNYLTPACL